VELRELYGLIRLLLALDDLVHEPVELFHRLELGGAQHSLVLGHLEEERAYNVAVVVEHEGLVLLHVHQLVHDVQLEVKYLAVYGVLAGVVEVKLHSTRCHVVKIPLTTRVVFEQLDDAGGQKVGRIVQSHLEGSTCPEVDPRLVVDLLVALKVVVVVELDVLKLRVLSLSIVLGKLVPRPKESNGRLLSSLICHFPRDVLGSPIFTVLVVYEGSETLVLVVISIGSIRWTEESEGLTHQNLFEHAPRTLG